MALKLTSGGWTSAQVENKSQRKTLRDAFFEQAGIKPAKSMRGVHKSPQARMTQFGKAVGLAADRLGDDSLNEANGLAVQSMAMVGLGLHAFGGIPDRPNRGIVAVSPEVLRKFFVTVESQALTKSLF